jgi:hypothetical protein
VSRFLARASRFREDNGVTARIAPSQRRLRDARAAGLRPRSSLLSLAGLAMSAALAIAWLGPRAIGWFATALELALAGGHVPPPDTGMFGAVLLGLLACGTVVAVLVVGRRPTPRSLGVSSALGEVPPWLTVLSSIAAIVLLGAWLRPVVAAAARGVDVGDVATAWRLWSTWIGRGLLALACVAVGLGLLERFIAGRRLWLGLHLTRAEARERARASGERRR